MPWAGSAVAVLLAALLVAAPGAHAAQATSYGTVSFSKHGLPGDTLAERTANLRRLRAAGVRAIRLDITWTAVEPVGAPPRDYDFAAIDREIGAITAAGLDVIGLLGYGHPDHSTPGGLVGASPAGGGLPPFGIGAAGVFPPDDPADFAHYARAVAEHLGDEVIAWEVWNEQNEGWRFWPPREDPPAYGRLLCAAHAAVKEADPETPVVYGGVFYPAVPGGLPGMSGPDFVRATYAADPRIGRCFDVLAYHPYPYPFTAPELDVPVRGSVLAARAGMRAALPPADRDTPLWITEIGWPTHDRVYGVSEAQQARYVARMQAATFASGVPVLSWYTYGDSPDDTGANQEAHFGFFDERNRPKPAFEALATFHEVFDGTRFVRDRSRALGLPRGRQNLGGRGFALEFRGRGRSVTALWFANESVAEEQGPLPAGGAIAGRAIRVRLPVEAPRVELVGHLGERRVAEARGGAITLTVGPSPVYVVERG